MTEQNNPDPEDRRSLIEYIFEGYGSPAYFTCKKSILSLFANGRTTGLVLESGQSITQAVAISDGFVLNKALQSINFGGEDITKNLLNHLEKSKKIIPYFDLDIKLTNEGEVRKKNATEKILGNVDETVRLYHKLNIVKDIKEAIVKITTPSDDQ